MDRVEKMLGRMKASKLYRCVDWDPEGKAKDLVDKFNSASRSEIMTRTGELITSCVVVPDVRAIRVNPSSICLWTTI